MITLLVYLTFPKTMSFHGLNERTLEAIARFLKGPDYRIPIFLDATLILLAVVVIGLIVDYKKSSSKAKP